MSTKTQRACAWTGPAMMVLFLIGFSISGFITPNSPHDSALKIEHLFNDHRTTIRLGLIISTVAAALLVTWAAAFAVQLRRACGRFSPLPLVMALSAALLSLEFIYLIMFWQTAAFRSNWSPETYRLLNDMGWVPFIGITCSGIVMAFASAIPILVDKRRNPIFPRWLGYFNLWVTMMFTPGTFDMFFHSGPLAYNGLIAWYIPITVYGLWLGFNTHHLLRAIRRQSEEEQALTQAGVLNAEQPLELEDLARQVAFLTERYQQAQAGAAGGHRSTSADSSASGQAP